MRRFPVIVVIEGGKPTMPHDELCKYMRALAFDTDRGDGVEYVEVADKAGGNQEVA